MYHLCKIDKVMKCFIRLLVSVETLCLMTICAYAQTSNSRTQGYHGNITLTDHLGVFVGVETSHGYMLDNHNYIGLGVGGFILPNNSHPTYMNTFFDYHNYLRDKSTLVLGVKAGWSHAFNYLKDSGIKYKNGVLCEPNIGWSWCLQSGKGLYLGLGATLVFPFGDSRTDQKVLPLRKISFGLEY